MPGSEEPLPRPALILCLLTVLVTGCGSHAAIRPTPTPKIVPTTLRWGIAGVSDVPTLDPALATDATSIGLASLIYGGLVRLDSHLRVRPDGAARWSISGAGL